MARQTLADVGIEPLPGLGFRLAIIAPRKHKGAVDAEPFGKGELDPEHGKRLE